MNHRTRRIEMEFVDDDQGFLNWKATHGNGFVLNTTRADDLMLHRATCPTLDRRGADLRWTSDDIKIRADEVDDLRRWAERHVRERVRLPRCSFCWP